MPFLSRALTRKKYPARCHSSYVHGVSYVFFRVRQQLETMWGLPPFEQQLLKRIVKESLAMTQNCLNAWKGRPAFSVLNASHYCIFYNLCDRCYRMVPCQISCISYAGCFILLIYIRQFSLRTSILSILSVQLWEGVPPSWGIT